MSDSKPFATQELLLLGEIRGIVQSLRDGQELHGRRLSEVENRFNARLDTLETKVGARLDGIDGRLRRVEQKAALAGAVSGGVVAVGTALIVERIKHWLG